MAGDEEMEDDDDDDFNPYLQRSPSADRESGESSKRVTESDDAQEEGGVVEQQEDEILAMDCAHQMFRGSEQFVGAFDGEKTSFEFASNDYVDEEFNDVEKEEMLRDHDFDGGSSSGKYSTKNIVRGEGRENVKDRLKAINYGGKTCDGEDMIANQNSDGAMKPMHRTDCSVSVEDLLYETQFKVQEDANALFLKIGEQSGVNVSTDTSEGEGKGLMDAICKRTRAHYSLADMSLDQLEMFLQESDEDEYFQTVDDEEEYRKFLVAVQESEDPVNKNPEQSNKKEEEEEEEEDVDFEVEIEEALESDDTSESLGKSQRKGPETREKRRERAPFQIKGPLLGQSIVPLRHLLPHVSNLADDVPLRYERKTMTETVSRVWPSNVKRKSAVNGFTAHQIGQLYCLIHEHVQLLVQVFSLCILEPARQKMAMDTHHMLMELVEKRELLLSWKKTAFPDFCFRPPYTHPSLTEDGDPVTCFDNWTSDTFSSTSTSCDQSTRVSSNPYPGSYFTHGSRCDPIFSSSHNLGQSTPMLPWSYSLSRILEPASISAHHYAQSTAGSCESWQETVQQFAAWMISPDQRQKTMLAPDGVSPSQIRNPTEASYSAVTGPFMVDSTSRPTSPHESDDDLFHLGSHGPHDDPACVTASHYHTSSVTSSVSAPVEVVLVNQEGYAKLGVVNPEPLPPAVVQTAACSEGAQMCVLPASGLGSQGKLEWAPATSGPVRSLLDVAPLALVRDYLMDVSHVVQEYRQRHVETGACHGKYEREPLFVMSAVDEQDPNFGRNQFEGTRSRLLGGAEFFADCIPRPQIKKTMAAALVESTKKQSLALVPKDVAVAVQRFLPYFNKVFFPHKPPPVATASRLLFTDAEDELLAMGLMIYNTDWQAIQQRFLPSKSMHQIFVRQKNRSSGRAPDNSIKTVHRMKSSSLTDLEKSSIQAGLQMFKYDWNKVWQYCVPHRDPAVLPRQWRIAVGTQKSYKTSETSKERRRIYEANRRQRIAAKKGAQPSHAGASLDKFGYKTGGKDADDPDKSYIREAFLDDWCPRSSPIVASGPTCVERQMKASLSKNRKAAGELQLHLPRPSLWPNSQTMNATCQNRKKTVKLAPGLPSVKLPSCVQVLSQSQKPFSFATRLPPSTSQWAQVTSQGLDKLQISVQATQLSSSLSDCATETTPMQEGGSASLQSIAPSIQSLYGQGQIKVPRATRVPNAQTGLTVQEPTQVLEKYSRPDQLPPVEKNHRQLGKRNAQECTERGDLEVRNHAKMNNKVVYRNKRETQNINQGSLSLSAAAVGSRQLRQSFVVEGIGSDISKSSRQSPGRVRGRNHSRKFRRVQEACVGRGGRESHLEQHIIVMEQEELSDSEDEPDAGVEFEHEEMGDSDKDDEVELRNAKQGRACKAQ